MGARIALALFVTGIMCAIGEGFLRGFAKPAPNVILQDLSDSLKAGHQDYFLTVIENDPELFWRLAPNRRLPDNARSIRGLISNAAGLREDHEIPLAKPPGEVRILFVGDSCTFGFGCLHPDTFVELAERELKRRHPGTRVECINAGVPGYTLEQGWRQLVRTGLAYQPDLIVVSFGWNDSKTWESRSDLEQYEDMRRATPPGILAHSALCRQIWRLATRRGTMPAATGHVPRVSPAEYEKLLRRIRDLAEAHHAEFLPLVWPVQSNFPPSGERPLTPYQETTYRLGREEFRFGPQREPGFIDLIPPIGEALRQNSIRELFIDGVHTRPLANRIIAQAIVEKLGGWYPPSAAIPSARRAPLVRSSAQAGHPHEAVGFAIRLLDPLDDARGIGRVLQLD